jgi:hypothetical protein
MPNGRRTDFFERFEVAVVFVIERSLCEATQRLSSGGAGDGTQPAPDEAS